MCCVCVCVFVLYVCCVCVCVCVCVVAVLFPNCKDSDEGVVIASFAGGRAVAPVGRQAVKSPGRDNRDLLPSPGRDNKDQLTSPGRPGVQGKLEGGTHAV